MNTINIQELPLSKLDDLYNKPDYIHISLGFNYTNEIILILTINKYFLNPKSTKYLRFDLNDKKFKKITLTKNNQINDENICNTITDFIKDFSDKINSNISEKQIRLSVSNESLEQYKTYKDIVINGNYNENLSKKYSLELPDTTIQRDFFKINTTKIAVFFDTINNTYQYSDDYAFNLSQFDEEYINYIDKLILEEYKNIERDTKSNLQYKSILDTLRSIYSEFFI